MEIQLIIRAPNQNIEDQVINCNMDWTVLKLKIHLSEVYPNSPIVQEQKLIYSGRLLHDHLELKDIIKQEDMESNIQILHLVCSGNHSPSTSMQNSNCQNWSNQSSSVQSDELSEDNIGTSSENVLRFRPNSFTSEMNNSQPQFPQVQVNTLPVLSNDPQILAQMAAMQQMYAQYLLQYWQSMNLSGTPGSVFPGASNTQPQQNANNVAHETVVQQPANQRINAPAAQVVEDNEFANRDWLDHVFLYFRFLILLSIVYFYTTPERFMLVIIIVVIAFLYHEGWFVRQGIAEAVIGQRNRGQAEPNPNAVNNNERPSPNDNDGNDGHELEAAMDGEDPPHAQNPDVANNNQVFSPLTFLTTFFSSLIPEPPPPVNIN